jgi:excisionase family DNA binding protein
MNDRYPLPENEVMTVKEVASYLRVHMTTVYRLIAAKRIPAFRMGSDWRILRTNLKELLQQHSANVIPPAVPSTRRGRKRKGAI